MAKIAKQKDKPVKKIKKTLQPLLAVSFLFFVLSVILSGILLSTKISLDKQYEKLNNQLSNNGQTFGKRIEDINSLAELLADVQSKNITWSLILYEIADKTPAGIKYSLLEIEKDKALLRLAGHAENKQDLVELKNSLKKSFLLSKINLPLDNINNNGQNIFMATAKIEFDNIK